LDAKIAPQGVTIASEFTLWVKGTQERNLTYVEKTMGALLRTRPTFKADDLTLALFAIPSIVRETIEFARSRRSPESFDLLPKPAKPYRAEDIQLCVFAKTMLAQGGYLQQRPELFGRLNAEAREMLAVKFPQAPDDWAEICAAGDWTAICGRRSMVRRPHQEDRQMDSGRRPAARSSERAYPRHPRQRPA